MREAFIGAGGALTGALIAGLVALLVNERSSRWKYEEWLLNHRQKAYVEMLLAMQEMVGLQKSSTRAERRVPHARVFAAYIQTALVAPPTVDEALPAALKANGAHLEDPTTLKLAEAAAVLQDIMQADLQRRRVRSGPVASVVKRIRKRTG